MCWTLRNNFTCTPRSGFSESFESSVTHTALDLIARALSVGVGRAAQTGTRRGLVRVPGTGWNIGHGCHMMKPNRGNAERTTGPLWEESASPWWIFLSEVQCYGAWWYLCSWNGQAAKQTVEFPLNRGAVTFVVMESIGQWIESYSSNGQEKRFVVLWWQ